MTVTVDAKTLASAVSRAIGSVKPAKGQILLTFVRCAASDGAMTIEATDLDIRIEITLPAQGELAPVLIEGDRLSSIAARLKDRGDIAIAMKDARVVTIDAGKRSRFDLPTLDAEAWPSIKTDEELPFVFTMDGSTLALVCGALRAAISSEATRYYLNGIYLHRGSLLDPQAGGHLCAVATDGHKAFARAVPVPDLPADMPGIIVPAFTCAAIARLVEGAGDIEVSCSSERIAVQCGDVEFMSKLIQGTYPDWRRVIPRTKPQLSYDAKALADAAATAAAGAAAHKNGKPLKLSFGEAETTLTAAENDTAFTGIDAAAHSLLDDHKVEAIGINATYLAEAIESLDAETIELALDGPGGPMVFRGATYDDRLACVMPQRV